jgi:GDP-L-fucose synthase
MLPKDAKIYIAGHTGMVGSAVVRKYQKEGFTNLLLKTRAELDLFDQGKVAEFFEKEKPEYVIVAAARVGGVKANMENLPEFLYENLQIQNNLIWQAHLHGVKKLMFLGSSCIYPRNAQQPIKEEYLLDGKLEPTNEGYAIAKIAGMKLCEYINEKFSKEFISCMPTNIFGENDNFHPEMSHVMAGIMGRMHKAKIENVPEVVIWGSGTPRREFLYVDDLADAIYFLMDSYADKQFVNVGTGIDISIKELAETLKKILGYEGALVFDTTKPDGMPRKLLDVSRLHKLGWKHSIPFEEGVQKMYDFYLKSVA